MTTHPEAWIAAAAEAAHKALNDIAGGWHYHCFHPEPGEQQECWKGDRAARMLAEDVMPAVLDALTQAGALNDPAVIRATAADWDAFVAAELGALQLTYEQLAGQARTRSFTSREARELWVIIGR